MKYRVMGVACLFGSMFVGTSARADPCGMVPPIWTGNTPNEIIRVGPQKTYVFYDRGVETFVIRPAFSGTVEQFGMLIPFPNPPAIRKVPDDIFAHLANAVEPPEVILNLRPRPRMRRRYVPSPTRWARESAIR